MKLYIRIENGQPIDHPMIEENLLQAFPELDINNLPSNLIEFVRVDHPEIGVYEVYEGSNYGIVNGVCKDIHQVRSMTVEEKLEKQTQVKSEWALREWNTWTFDEETCQFKPPTLPPQDGKLYLWNEATTSWYEYNPNA